MALTNRCRLLASFKAFILVLLLVISQSAGRRHIQLIGNRKGNNSLQKLHWRIVGGRPVEDIRTHPYMVSVMACVSKSIYGHCPERDQRHDCGGALLNNYYVLTACHCVAEVDRNGPPREIRQRLRYYTFVAGTTNVLYRGPYTQVRYARRLHHHPKCATIEGSIINDLGLAEVRQPFDINEYVKPVPFLEESDLEKKVEELTVPIKFNDPERIQPYDPINVEGRCTVAGWGDTREGQKDPAISSDTLNVVEMFFIPESECLVAYSERDSLYEDFSFKQYHQVCAVSRHRNESDCIGDSGSPIICDGYLVATVSYGFECGKEQPSVYQTTANLKQWFTEDILKQRKLVFARAGISKVDTGAIVLCLVPIIHAYNVPNIFLI